MNVSAYDYAGLTGEADATETSILGAMLIDPAEIPRVLEALADDEFQHPQVRQIVPVLRAAANGSQQVDIATLAPLLTTDQTRFVMECMEICPTTAHLDEYIGIVREASQARRLKAGVWDILRGGGNSAETAQELRKVLDREEARTAGHDIRRRSMQGSWEFLESLYDKSEMERRVSTGWLGLDMALGGLRPKTLSYVGARPSVGKTTFALNILLHQWRKAKPAVFFSLEMSIGQIHERLISNVCQLPYDQIRDRRLTKEEQDNIAQKVAAMHSGEHSITIIDDILTVEGITQAVTRLKPQLVVVDYIQIVRATKPHRDRRTEVDYISGEFKQLARRCNCHVMVLSQISREGADRPTMSSMKESGGLEQDGDYIMLLHRPYVQDKAGGASPTEAHVLLDKNKYGECGHKEFVFDGKYQRFREARPI